MALNDFSALDALKPDTHFLLPQAQSKTSPVSNTRPKDTAVQPFRITQIPGAMRRMGWHTGAALMQRWFDTPKFEMSEEWKAHTPDARNLTAAECDETIVKMSWVTGYARAVEALRSVHGRMDSEPALLELCAKLQKRQWDGAGYISLGHPNLSARLMDSICQVNVLRFGEVSDRLDGMYGALGVASVKIGLIGEAWQDSATGRRLFRVQKSGVYVRDTYDFNGPQFLGIWTASRVLTKAESVSVTVGGVDDPSIVRMEDEAFTMVWNRDFRRYRNETGKGGDFIIYSDVQWMDENRVLDITSAWERLHHQGVPQ